MAGRAAGAAPGSEVQGLMCGGARLPSGCTAGCVDEMGEKRRSLPRSPFFYDLRTPKPGALPWSAGAPSASAPAPSARTAQQPWLPGEPRCLLRKRVCPAPFPGKEKQPAGLTCLPSCKLKNYDTNSAAVAPEPKLRVPRKCCSLGAARYCAAGQARAGMSGLRAGLP